ncbi:MAG: hypothetical protein ACRCX2_12945 [Paraclostridium sp.]
MKELLFILDADGESVIIEGVYRPEEDVVKFKDVEGIREFEDVEDYRENLVEGYTEGVNALIRSIQLDATLVDRIRQAKGSKLRVEYDINDLPVEAIKNSHSLGEL